MLFVSGSSHFSPPPIQFHLQFIALKAKINNFKRTNTILISIPGGNAADISIHVHPSKHKHRNKTKLMSNNNKTNTNNNSNTHSQACAACKYQRRKCTPDCILAPYFPHNRQRQFLNAHKLFGVSNITKLIKDLPQSQKDEAMRTIIMQSDIRADDPVGGCYARICQLHHHIDICRAELDIVLHQLAICRAQNQLPGLFIGGDPNDDSSSILVNADNLCLYDEDPIMTYHQDESYILQGDHHYDGDGGGGVCLHDQIDAWAMQDSGPSSLEVKQSSSSGNEFCDNNNNNNMKPTFLDDDEAGGEGQEFKFEFEEQNDRRFESLSLSLVS